MEKVKVLITGVTGQDGSYMVDYLLDILPEAIVYGGVRRLSVDNYENISHVKSDRFRLIDIDLSDQCSVSKVIREIEPNYVINFAANSFVGNSWDMPVNHLTVNTLGVLHLLEAIRLYVPHANFYQASSSEMFGDVQYSPQDIDHPLRPRSPYGVSKCASHLLTKVYRESYGLYAVSGICFNHESPRRKHEFVTRKITRNAALIAQKMMRGLPWQPMQLGNMGAKRDWSHAKDVVDGVWRMLNQETPKDYVLASGETHTVAEFVDKTFAALGIDGELVFENDEPDWSKAIYQVKWANAPLVVVNEKFFRPAEVDLLLGDPKEAEEDLGWERNYSFDALIDDMVTNDMKLVAAELSKK